MLEILHRIASAIQNIPFNIHPKSDEYVDNNGRPHGDERNVNKIFSDNRSGDPKAFSNCSTNAKYMPFDKMLEIFHTANLHAFNDFTGILIVILQ